MTAASPAAFEPRDVDFDLINAPGHALVSIAMPTHRSGPEVRGDSIRFKNLVREALKKLERQYDIHGEAAERRLAEFMALPNNATFWRHQTEGLLALHDGETTRFIHLHHRPRPSVTVGPRYDLSSLVMDRSRSRQRLCLAVTKHNAALFEVDGDNVSAVTDGPFPTSFDELITERDPEKQLQYHSQGVSGRSPNTDAPIYHGQGHGESKREADLENYYARVLRLLSDYRGDDRRPVVLMATEEVAGHIAARADIDFDAVVEGSMDGMNERSVIDFIHDHIWEHGDDPSAIIERFGTAASRDQGSDDLGQILGAVSLGAVETLLVDTRLMIDGRVKEDRQLSDEQRDQLGSILRLAAETSADIRFHDGTNRLVENRPVAAIFRYPLPAETLRHAECDFQQSAKNEAEESELSAQISQSEAESSSQSDVAPADSQNLSQSNQETTMNPDDGQTTTAAPSPVTQSGMPTGTMPMTDEHLDQLHADDQSAGVKQQLVGATEQVKSAAAEKIDEAKQVARRKAEQTAETARVEAERLKQQARGVVNETAMQAKSSAQRLLDTKKQRVTGELAAVEQAIDRTRQRLQQDNHDSLAQYADIAAEKVQRLRSQIENKNIDEIIDDVQSFARRQPALVFGGLFVAGLVAMRFMKASSADRTERQVARQREGGVELTPRQAAPVVPSDRFSRSLYNEKA